MADCTTRKIDSNITSLRYAEEECAGQLPSAPVWNPLEPNSYGAFGATVTTVARTPIDPNRQRKKGVSVDVDAEAAFNMDLTQTNAQDLLQGFLFADTRTKAAYTATISLAVVITAGLPTLVGTGLLALGLTPGESVFVGGDSPATFFATAANNGFKRVRSVSDTVIVLDKSDLPMVAEAAKPVTLYLGRVLKNEVGALIKSRSYQLERTLGSLDGLTPHQSQYIVGGVPSEMVLNLGLSSIVNADYSFVALDGETRTQAQGLKAGTRPAMVESDAFNTTSDLHRIRIAPAGGNASPDALFGFATELTLTINNTLSPAKALGVMGAFAVTAGTFAVSGSATAYFSDVRAVQAVRDNADISLDLVFVKANSGIVIDLPLVTLGDGVPAVELDSPIMLPLTSEAASGAKVHANLDYTICFTFFATLPNRAA